MAAWRTVAVAFLALLLGPKAWGQTYTLSEKPRPGDCFRIHLDLVLSGEIKIRKEGKLLTVKQQASAMHEFPERILNVGDNGLPAKAARFYEQASSSISLNGEASERRLRPERQLLVAQRHKDQPLAYSPVGTLLRDELELSDHFDTLWLTGLLPGRDVAAGDTWKLSNALAQALCSFEGLTEQSLVCKLEGVKDQLAHVSVTGAATGIDLGALVKLNVEAGYQFDLNTKHLTRLQWKQKEERDQGPASPAMTLQATSTLTRAPIQQPDALSDVAIAVVPDGFEPPMLLTQLELRDPKAGYTMTYARDWQTVSSNDQHTVMRLMERGDFVAQLTITPWTKADKGKHLTPDEFRQAMAETPGWEVDQELQAGEVPAEGGRWIYRISALGNLDGAKVMQNFYLVAGPGGEQLVLVFTMVPKQADRIATRDLALVGSVEFLDRKVRP
ncbi:MAG TPA: hypothetical protein VGY58_06930 [Gemmataceae bacterium]|jgi:hypothetical protein|nr:hypothetical protein [Gemmataceae bacterium]